MINVYIFLNQKLAFFMQKYVVIKGIDIKDIPNVNDQDFSVTLNGFFLVRWTDSRLILNDVKAKSGSSLPINQSLH
jgi:hypothetical protein